MGWFYNTWRDNVSNNGGFKILIWAQQLQFLD